MTRDFMDYDLGGLPEVAALAEENDPFPRSTRFFFAKVAEYPHLNRDQTVVEVRAYSKTEIMTENDVKLRIAQMERSIGKAGHAGRDDSESVNRMAIIKNIYERLGNQLATKNGLRPQ